jgi:hypothetical protein
MTTSNIIIVEDQSHFAGDMAALCTHVDQGGELLFRGPFDASYCENLGKWAAAVNRATVIS